MEDGPLAYMFEVRNSHLGTKPKRKTPTAQTQPSPQ
jgi:hypothetical protein